MQPHSMVDDERLEHTVGKKSEKKVKKAEFCCEDLQQEVEYRCDVHRDPYECADNVIVKEKKYFGLPIHDGGASFVRINFCPWCGTRLGKGKRSRMAII